MRQPQGGVKSRLARWLGAGWRPGPGRLRQCREDAREDAREPAAVHTGPRRGRRAALGAARSVNWELHAVGQDSDGRAAAWAWGWACPLLPSARARAV